jgi:LAGLIDADG DNA endonuclease family
LTAFIGYVLPFGQMSFWGIDLPDMEMVYCSLPVVGILVDSRRGILSTPRAKAFSRIGPHNIDILSIFIGSLLGNAQLECRGKGCRFCFQQEHNHEAYLRWFYDYLAIRGYTTGNIPEIATRLGYEGKIRKLLRFKTWNSSSFIWIHDLFYTPPKDVAGKYIKIVPNLSFLDTYLSPLALAVWIAADGARVGVGLKLCVNGFSHKECTRLADLLLQKYNLMVTVQSAGALNQYHLFVHKQSMEDLYSIVKPHLHPCMRYKFGLVF